MPSEDLKKRINKKANNLFVKDYYVRKCLHGSWLPK